MRGRRLMLVVWSPAVSIYMCVQTAIPAVGDVSFFAECGDHVMANAQKTHRVRASETARTRPTAPVVCGGEIGW